MLPVISIGQIKTSGTSTLALTLAGVLAAADIPVTLIDAARDGDLKKWAARRRIPAKIDLVRTSVPGEIERLVRAARRRNEAAIIDAGDLAETIREAAMLADRAIIPVRFSPLSAYGALVTDEMLADDEGRGRVGRDRCFVASAITAIPSRVARSIEGIIEASPTQRMPVGLAQRAAYEAPFLLGGTLFSLGDEMAPGLDRARAEAATLAYELGLLGDRRQRQPQRRTAGLRQAA